MKVAIIGGGIAGLTQGILLRNYGFDVKVFERTPQIVNRGHAFLMSRDGVDLLESFSNEFTLPLPMEKVDIFSLKRPDGVELIKIPLAEWFCMKRVDLMQFLNSFYTEDELNYSHEFSHFLFDENDHAHTVVFKNDKSYKADFFIGADGSNSSVRQSIFGSTEYLPIEVREVVGISGYSVNSQQNVFQKIQSADKGLAFGYIPARENESVWFMQYDVNLENGENLKDPESLKAFCINLLKDFPEEVRQVLDNNDFRVSYTWNTRDFDLLPSFHRKNVVLIGDAAHLALPFTSAGTTNAIIDAFALLNSLLNKTSLEEAFNSFYLERNKDVGKHIDQGREIKKIFLEPRKYSERGYILPLIPERDKSEFKSHKKPLKIAYFTDPICSTCWIFQSLLRKIYLEYDHAVEITYHMGGLLPDWISQQGKKINSPSDAAQLWDELGRAHEIPMNGQVWVTDPLESSFPPSLAFKAAQLQGDDKAISFLRRIKELLFIDNKNISRWEFIEIAALDSGIDVALLRRDIENDAILNFQEDLILATKLGIQSFPTLVIESEGKPIQIIKGLQEYEDIEQLIKSYVPDIEKNKDKITPEELFQRYDNMTEKEFCFLLNYDAKAGSAALEYLNSSEFISRVETVNAVYWKRV
jgi:2-polyprenyl-6-methoxyphenol hydroxylase-like FAD-dependent oxidoreductase/predicted DsbA family dithiol-disulfide isomerase